MFHEKKKKKYSREQLSKVLCVSGWMFSSDIAFLVSRKKKYENESDRGIVDWTKKKIVPRSAINYVLFSKSNQGHPDDKRCNKYTLFKDILDTANCLIS